MIALLLTDIHGRADILGKILASAGPFDLVVVSGDLTDFGNKKTADEIISILKKAGKPVFAVPGNCDPPEVRDAIEAAGVSLHNKKKEQDGYTFAGFGGSTPTPFNTPFEMPEEEFSTNLGSLCTAASGAKRLVLVTHAPPKNTGCDTLPGGAHAGSQAVRDAVETRQPTFLFCGHIHEGISTETIGKTVVVNPGPARSGNYGIADLKSKKIRLERLDGDA